MRDSCWAAQSFGPYTATQAYWNLITIGGSTIQQAVSKWWIGSASAAAQLTKDCIWTVASTCLPACMFYDTSLC